MEGALKHSELTAEQKDRKMRAKRIIKLILPQLLEAASNEADLGLGSREAERDRIESILDASVRPNPESVHFKGDGGYSEDEAENEQVLRQIAPNGQIEAANEDGGNQDDVDGKHSAEDIEMRDARAPNPPESSPSLPNGHGSEMANSAAHEGNSKDGIIIISNVEPAEPTSARATPALPALSNSGSTNPSTTNHDPLTPPQTDKDLLAPLAHGGKVWYLDAFEPVGTTIRDERWPGRDVLRGMSEELSELDEETMNGLVDDDDMHDVQVGAVPTAETLKVAAAQRKRSQRKRKRAW
jgi:NuA3 HAT complex component NTO1